MFKLKWQDLKLPKQLYRILKVISHSIRKTVIQQKKLLYVHHHHLFKGGSELKTIRWLVADFQIFFYAPRPHFQLSWALFCWVYWLCRIIGFCTLEKGNMESFTYIMSICPARRVKSKSVIKVRSLCEWMTDFENWWMFVFVQACLAIIRPCVKVVEYLFAPPNWGVRPRVSHFFLQNLNLANILGIIAQGVFCDWCPPENLKYGKPRLGESRLT